MKIGARIARHDQVDDRDADDEADEERERHRGPSP
jgi:hypothetical protein